MHQSQVVPLSLLLLPRCCGSGGVGAGVPCGDTGGSISDMPRLMPRGSCLLAASARAASCSAASSWAALGRSSGSSATHLQVTEGVAGQAWSSRQAAGEAAHTLSRCRSA